MSKSEERDKYYLQLDTLALRERDPGLVALASDEDVADAGGEGAVEDVADLDDVKASEVALAVHDDSRASHVASAGDGDDVAGLELDKVNDLVLDEVDLDGVVDLDGRVGVADGASVVGDEVRDTLGAKLDLLDLAELVGRLLRGDAVDREAALNVVQEAEVLARLLDRDDVHEAGGEGLVGADLLVDLDQALLDNQGDLTGGEGVLEAVAEEDGEGQALAELVGSGRRAGSAVRGKARKAHVSGLAPPGCKARPSQQE